MLTVEHATFLSSIFTTFLANVISVTIVGCLRAHVAAYFGDDTAERLGFLTLNPLAHVDIFFIISFMLFGIGLGQYPYIEYDFIQGKHKRAMFYTAYFFNTVAYIMLSIIALTSLLVIFGPSILELFRSITLTDGNVMRYYPSISSLSLSLALFGVAAVYINGLLAVFSLFINLLRLVGFPILNHFFHDAKYKDIWVLISAIILIYLLINPLRIITSWIIFGTGYALAHVVGISG
jgi:hypothetical protein